MFCEGERPVWEQIPPEIWPAPPSHWRERFSGVPSSPAIPSSRARDPLSSQAAAQWSGPDSPRILWTVCRIHYSGRSTTARLCPWICSVGTLPSTVLRRSLARVAWFAQRLPVAPIPEQPHVAFVWDYVGDLRREAVTPDAPRVSD